MIQKRKKTPGAHKATTMCLLSGLIKCGECGYAFQENNKKYSYRNEYISYRCDVESKRENVIIERYKEGVFRGIHITKEVIIYKDHIEVVFNVVFFL